MLCVTTMTLKQARELVGLSQAQLAEQSGVQKSSIADIETHRVAPENVAHGTIVRLVRALQRAGIPGLTTDQIFPVAERVA